MSEEAFPITAAQLSGNFCETLFYGMYLITCCFCGHTLLITGSGTTERWLRPNEIRWLMAFVAVSLFVINTFDVGIGLLHNFNAFVYAPQRGSNAVEEFHNIADWINIARSFNQVIAMILGDFVLIYRCWIVYGKRWFVIGPSLLLYLGGISMAAKLMEVEVNPSTVETITLNSDQIRPWWLSFFAITAVQNLLTTSILIWRIWRVERESEKYIDRSGSIIHRPRHLRKVIRTIAESGAAYTLCVFVTFMVSVSKSNALYPTSDMALQATGIAFNVILVRSSARRDHQFTVFDHNERTTITDRTGRSSTVNSMMYRERPGSQDVELAVTAIGSGGSDGEKDKQSDIYPRGITVTTSVVKS